MTRFHNLSIKNKLTAINMITICLALLLACAGFVLYEQFAFKKNLVSELSTLTEITGKNCVGAFTFDNPDGAANVLANLSAIRQITAGCVYKDGKPWARYPATLRDDQIPPVPGQPEHRFEKRSLALFR